MATFNVQDLHIKKRASLEKIIEQANINDGLDELKLIKKILNQSFGEENNQIVKPSIETIKEDLEHRGYTADILNRQSTSWVDILSMDAINYTILIRFPEIKITNSRRRSHIIKDLYVRFHVNREGKVVGNFDGTRTSLTLGEMRASYAHSHLTRFGSWPTWSHFCTGSGEINQVFALLRDKFDEINFTLLCLHLKNYVAWESLEGTPYNFMSNITAGSAVRKLNPNTVDKVVTFLHKKLFSGEKSNTWIIEHLGMVVTHDNILSQPTEVFEQWASEAIENVSGSTLGISTDSLFVTMDSSGRYYSIREETRGGVRIPTAPVFMFKGEPIYFKIINSTHETEVDKYVHPDITQELRCRLSRKFTKAAIKFEGFEVEENTFSGITETAESDPLPL